MFLKKFRIKHNLSLKSSDVKRLHQRLQQTFPGANLEFLVTSKMSVTQLKLMLHNGKQAIVYCWDKLPYFFELEEGEEGDTLGKRLIPTVYALWQIRDLLPYFTTSPPVLRRLNNGADLLLPGVIPQGQGLNMYGHYKKHQLVAVNLSSNLAAVGIGYLPRSSDDLYMCGGYGVAVKMLHLFGDHLWSLESTLIQQLPQIDPGNSANLKIEENFPELGAVRGTTTTTTTTTTTNTMAMETVINSLDELNLKSCEENSGKSSEMETPEILLKNAFLSALKKHGKSLPLPLLTSNFYRLYMVPEFLEPFDIKRSSYKKLSNFLNAMINENFIVVREESKGIDKITAIDHEHPELVNFIAEHRTPGTSTLQQAQETTNEQSMALLCSEMVEMYTITGEAAPIFTVANYQLGQDLALNEIKDAVRKYIKQRQLKVITKKMEKSGGTTRTMASIVSNSKSNVDSTITCYQLDETLTRICSDTLPSSQNYATTSGEIVTTFNAIIDCLLERMQLIHKMCNSVRKMNGTHPSSSTSSSSSSNNQTKRSSIPIKMWLGTRKGNKTITLVSGMEAYGIRLNEFMRLCKKGAATNASIVTVANEKSPVFQVQGNQIRFIYKLLTETCKIPTHCITGLQFAIKEKTKK